MECIIRRRGVFTVSNAKGEVLLPPSTGHSVDVATTYTTCVDLDIDICATSAILQIEHRQRRGLTIVSYWLQFELLGSIISAGSTKGCIEIREGLIFKRLEWSKGETYGTPVEFRGVSGPVNLETFRFCRERHFEERKRDKLVIRPDFLLVRSVLRKQQNNER